MEYSADLDLFKKLPDSGAVQGQMPFYSASSICLSSRLALTISFTLSCV